MDAITKNNFKIFLEQFIDDKESINFIITFVNDTKLFIKHRKLLIFYALENTCIIKVIKYIEEILDSVYITNSNNINKSTDSINKHKNLIIIDNTIRLPIIKEILFNDDIKGNLLTQTNNINKYIHRTMNDKIKIIEFKNSLIEEHKLVLCSRPKLERTYKCSDCLIGQTLKNFNLFDKKGYPKCCIKCENKKLF